MTRGRYGRWTVGLLLLVSVGLWTGQAAAQPTVEVRTDGDTARVGDVYSIRYVVQWDGAADAYGVTGTRFEPIDWGAMTVKAGEGRVNNGQPAIVYVAELVPDEPGEHTVPEVFIDYRDRNQEPGPAGQEAPNTPTGSDDSPSLRAASFPLRVTPDATPTWPAALIGFAVMLGGLSWWLWRTRRRRLQPALSLPSDSRANGDAGRHALAEAHRLRVAGDYYAFYQHLERAVATGAPDQAELRERFAAAAQSVGYRGTTPPADEVESDLRAATNALNQRREEPHS